MNYFTPYVHVFHQQRDYPVATGEVRTPPARSGANREVNRLLSAAVINERFRHLLLSDAKTALEMGFNGETFSLSPEERERVLSIRATSLQSFAEQLLAPGKPVPSHHNAGSGRDETPVKIPVRSLAYLTS